MLFPHDVKPVQRGEGRVNDLFEMLISMTNQGNKLIMVID